VIKKILLAEIVLGGRIFLIETGGSLTNNGREGFLGVEDLLEEL
jgi:hypothetical protein